MKESPLDESQRRIVLDLAREAIRIHLESGRQIGFPPHEFLLVPSAAFVTVKMHGELRGCIGSTEARHPLGETIVQCAISAAFRDPRFPPLSKEEYEWIRLEVSLLSPFRQVQNVEDIQIGVHGVFVTYKGFRGLLLPQVAIEQEWDREAFLSYTCQKAGLPTDAWRHMGVNIEVFSAEVFGEAE